MPYFTDAGPKSGPILRGDDYGPIDVLKGQGDRTPIGTALSVGSTPWGIAVWAITVRGAVVPGRWIVLGREFVPHLPAGPPADAPEGDRTCQLERPVAGQGRGRAHGLRQGHRPARPARPRRLDRESRPAATPRQRSFTIRPEPPADATGQLERPGCGGGAPDHA